MKAIIILTIGMLVHSAASAMVETDVLVRKNAFFEQNKENELYEPLNLRRKTFTFKRIDLDNCEKNLTRSKDTLKFSCTLTLPRGAKISKRQNQITPVVMMIPYAGSDRRVFITVPEDMSQVIYSTEFDKTGFDFEMTTFNDDFFKVYERSALNVIADAMSKTLQVETLDSRAK